MKKVSLLLLVLFTCVLSAQRKPKIKGSRIITEVQKELQPYNAIKLMDDLKIKLQHESVAGYNIIADDNLIDALKFEVIDSVLTIGSFYKIVSKKQLEILVNYTVLNKVILNTGSIVMDDMVGGANLAVHTYGDSKIQLNTNATLVGIHMEGNSEGSYSVDANSLVITLKDKVNAEIQAVSEEISVEMSNGASSKLEGSTTRLKADLTGDIDLKAEKLQAVTVEALLQKSSGMRLQALETFNLSSRDKAKTYLYGNPVITITEFLDASELIKRDLKK